MIDLQIQHHFSSDLYARQQHLPAAHIAHSHRHRYYHLSILAQGEVLLEVNGVTAHYCAPACITVVAEAIHAITALTDTDWFCIHATNHNSSVCAPQHDLPAGHVAHLHRPQFDHLGILAQGEVLIEVNGLTTGYCAPACVTIAANAIHEITALTDSVWFCVYATNETELDQIDHVLVKGE